jgi:mRNA interferase MazF
MSCSRNDVILLPIPFTDLTSRKVRPAVVIGRSGVDLFVVPISSQLQNTAFALVDWRTAGLNVLRHQTTDRHGGGKARREDCWQVEHCGPAIVEHTLAGMTSIVSISSRII